MKSVYVSKVEQLVKYLGRLMPDDMEIKETKNRILLLEARLKNLVESEDSDPQTIGYIMETTASLIGLLAHAHELEVDEL